MESKFSRNVLTLSSDIIISTFTLVSFSNYFDWFHTLNIRFSAVVLEIRIEKKGFHIH